MSLLTLLNQLFHKRSRKPVRHSGRSRRAWVGHAMTLEALEDRTVPQAVSWVNPGSGFWDVGSNWSTESVPNATDDVTINQSNITISLRDTEAVNSLHTSVGNDLVEQTGGSLTLAASSELDGAFTLSGGSLYVNGTLTLAGNSQWTAGSISGTGSLTNSGTLTLSGGDALSLGEDLNNNGTLAISPATALDIQGNYTQGANATLDVQLGGSPASGQFGQLNVAAGSSATLAGILQTELVDGYVPSAGDDFTVMTYPSNSNTTFAHDNLSPGGSVTFQAQVTDTNVTLNSDTAPAITTQPSSQTVLTGQPVSFMAAASGAPTPSVQWQVSTDGGVTFTNISGATSNTLTLTADSSQSGDEYQAVFTNSAGSATTNVVTLTVTTDVAPSITTQPSNQTVTVGQTVSFTAAASGTPAPTVQWQVSTDGGVMFNNISGATSATLTFTTDSSQNGDEYQAVFTNSVGVATTTDATLTEDFAPSITTQPGNQTVTAGQTVSFTAAASGTPTPTVQWQISTDGGHTFSNIANANSTTLSFPATVAENGDEYQAVFTNTIGTATTTPATLIVDFAPSVTSNPTNQTAASGQTATFTAAASANPTASVQWQISTDGGHSFSKVANATSTTLSLTVTGADNGDEFQAVFTNSVGSVTTTAATLTVIQASIPVFTSANHATFVVGKASTFTVATSATPTPALSELSTLPAGLTFTDNHDGTATLSGTPAANTGITEHLVFLAFNGKSATQTFTLTINQAPVVTTQPASQTVAAGHLTTLTAAATANPAATVHWQVSTDGGTTFKNIAGATSATLRVTPTTAQNDNEYRAVFTNSVGSVVTDAATLTVYKTPAITSVNHAAFALGTVDTFTITTSGFPAATLSELADLPAGLTFTDNHNGTATLSGTPTVGALGTHVLTFVATNDFGSASQTFVLNIDQPPVITTSPSSLTVAAGQKVTFTAAASGTPAPAVQWQISTNGGGSFRNILGATSTTLSFTAAAGANGAEYRAVFTNIGGSVATAAATLTVDSAPRIISANQTTFKAGAESSFTIITTGFPAADLSVVGTLPTGLKLIDNHDGTFTISGIPAAKTIGTYHLKLVASNEFGSITQDFTLVVGFGRRG